jgi:polysaccharide deacetylase family protein (PEP-CTERM system associated)
VRQTRQENGRLKNAITVDVEEHFQVSAFEGVVGREDWESMPSRVEDNTARLLDLMDTEDVRGTFFVLGWVGERRPALVRRIADRGHEIASHGHSHRLIYEQSPGQFRRELDRSRKSLQDASGQPVDGHRAASFSITRRNLWALDVVSEAGFHYDSSLFPVRHDRYGIPGAPRGPYRLRTPAGGLLVEVPPSTVILWRWAVPVAGGGYLRLYPEAFTHWAIRRLNERDAMPANIYVHPWEVDPEQPRMAGLSWKSRVRHYINLGTTLGKLRRLFRTHRFGPLGEIVKHSDDFEEIQLH